MGTGRREEAPISVVGCLSFTSGVTDEFGASLD